MKSVKTLIFYYLTLSSLFCVSQVNPTSHDPTTFNGVACLACNSSDEDKAYDNSRTTFMLVDLDLTLLAYSETAFNFATNIPQSSLITVELAFEDVTNYFGDIVANDVLEFVEIELQTNIGGTVFTYNAGNQSTVELIDANSNRVRIKIINPYSNVQKLVLRTGGITTVPFSDVKIYDINYEERNFLFADEYIAGSAGFYNGASLLTLSVSHDIVNEDHATYSAGSGLFDVNSEFTSFQHTVFAGLGSEYLTSSYTWSGGPYSGLDNDLFILMEDASLAAVSLLPINVTILDLFSSNLISINITYSDASTELFANGDPKIEAQTALLGDSKFFIRIDLDDTKLIEDVEIRFAPDVAVLAELNVYSIFLAPQETVTPLPVELIGLKLIEEDETGHLFWEVNAEYKNDFFTVIQKTDQGEIINLFKVSSIGDHNDSYTYSLDIPKDKRSSTIQLYQTDFNGDVEHLGDTKLSGIKSNLRVFPNPATHIISVDSEEDELNLFDMNGKLVSTINKGMSDISHLKPGVYYLEGSESRQKIVKQ